LKWDTITKARAEYIAGIIAEMACRSIGLVPVSMEQNKQDSTLNDQI